MGITRKVMLLDQYSTWSDSRRVPGSEGRLSTELRNRSIGSEKHQPLVHQKVWGKTRYRKDIINRKRSLCLSL